jgi:hypothetical protein
MTVKLQDKGVDRRCDSLDSVVGRFLDEQGETTETRLQNLVFVTEVYATTYCRRRLTGAEFRPYMYGAYSPDVSETLSDSQCVTEHRRLKNGNRTTVYSSDGSNPKMDDSRETIVESVSDYTSGVDTDTLAQFSKDSWLFEHTPEDDPMQFTAFRDALDRSSDLEQRVKLRLPAEPEVDCDGLCDLR